MAELENRFTWSLSRDGSFRYCPRQYWWNYYGSWGGWKAEAPGEVRTAYVLKSLSNRWAWVGSLVHSAIEGLLRQAQAAGADGLLAFERPAIGVDRELDALSERMRREWSESRDGEYWRNPKRHVGLIEHEYREAVPPEEWQAMHQRARAALRAFLESDAYQRIRRSSPTRWLPIEQLDSFDFEGTPVWVVLDFALERPDGGIDIYDWKTGEVKPESDRTQLAIYAQYLHSARQIEPTHVSTHLVYLGQTAREFDFRVGEAELKEARGVMRASIAAMRTRLRDPERNGAAREDFPLTDDLERCRVCAFRRLCGRDGA